MSIQFKKTHSKILIGIFHKQLDKYRRDRHKKNIKIFNQKIFIRENFQQIYNSCKCDMNRICSALANLTMLILTI